MLNNPNKISQESICNSIFNIQRNTKTFLNEKTQRPVNSNSFLSKTILIPKEKQNFFQVKPIIKNQNNIEISENEFENDLNQKYFNITKNKKEKDIKNEFNKSILDFENNFDINQLFSGKKLVPKLFNSEIKINLQENFDKLCFEITDITKLIYKICNKGDSVNIEKEYEHYKIIYQKKEQILLILEQLNKNLKEYHQKVFCLGKFFEKSKEYFKENNFSFFNEKFDAMKKIYNHENEIYKSNIKVFEKMKMFIPSLCNKLLLHIENNKKLLEVEKKVIALKDKL